MKANEIRALAENMNVKDLGAMVDLQMKIRIETAAQLAELNDHLRRIVAVPHFRADDEVTG